MTTKHFTLMNGKLVFTQENKLTNYQNKFGRVRHSGGCVQSYHHQHSAGTESSYKPFLIHLKNHKSNQILFPSCFTLSLTGQISKLHYSWTLNLIPMCTLYPAKDTSKSLLPHHSWPGCESYDVTIPSILLAYPLLTATTFPIPNSFPYIMM